MTERPRLSIQDVRHVAHLARLQSSETEIEGFRADLASILEYVALLEELDVTNVEPLTHPGRSPAASNRLDQDEPQSLMPIDSLRLNAPAMEGSFIAVPKVISGVNVAEGG